MIGLPSIQVGKTDWGSRATTGDPGGACVTNKGPKTDIPLI